MREFVQQAPLADALLNVDISKHPRVWPASGLSLSPVCGRQTFIDNRCRVLTVTVSRVFAYVGSSCAVNSWHTVTPLNLLPFSSLFCVFCKYFCPRPSPQIVDRSAIVANLSGRLMAVLFEGKLSTVLHSGLVQFCTHQYGSYFNAPPCAISAPFKACYLLALESRPSLDAPPIPVAAFGLSRQGRCRSSACRSTCWRAPRESCRELTSAKEAPACSLLSLRGSSRPSAITRRG